jgi:hypothetical protein
MEGESIRFNVFGKIMSVKRSDEKWLLFNISNNGINARIYDVAIPSDMDENEIARYLGDIYHEYADEANSSVVKLD